MTESVAVGSICFIFRSLPFTESCCHSSVEHSRCFISRGNSVWAFPNDCSLEISHYSNRMSFIDTR